MFAASSCPPSDFAFHQRLSELASAGTDQTLAGTIHQTLAGAYCAPDCCHQQANIGVEEQSWVSWLITGGKPNE